MSEKIYESYKASPASGDIEVTLVFPGGHKARPWNVTMYTGEYLMEVHWSLDFETEAAARVEYERWRS